ncbi:MULTISPECIES: hypothetical protein [Sutcliffiella]|uniref:Uncharacterized protein n=1 Tax=Sutcliffiella cohnii TaxID=33932 RepID=A0A223KSR8_9BACI|nr:MULTISPECIES: hypothetical protein [Sutcliffiella]AST92363.1 hypothetical protein BC6307_14220 [Sutcliffiella cohnii]MED4017174.1 hypothetical protein [Sutcliffiella cohnii]WBL13593.1 hypothetical protein O1A01_16940 [Sutcliffiella sp. NC1]
MNQYPLIFLACILAGFALTRVPLTGFLAPVEPLAFIVGVLTVLLFSSVLIFRGVVALFNRNI